MIVDKLMERANAVSGTCDAELISVDYEIEGDDTVVYCWFADDFNNGNPIIASVPTSELVDRDMFETTLRVRFGLGKALRATA